MSYFASDIITGSQVAVALTAAQFVRRPVPISTEVGEVMCDQGVITFASGLNPAANDVIEFCILPADHVLVDWQLSADQFDSSTGLTVTLGLMTGAVGDVTRTQTAFPAANAAGNGAAALVFGRTASDNFARNATSWFERAVVSTSTDRSVGLTFAAAPTTSPAALRRMALKVFYRAARQGG